jgi:hypothetical protein
MSDIKTVFRELPLNMSQEYLNIFESLEEPDGMDWFESDEAERYIWLLDISNEKEIPIGFIGYNELKLNKDEDFFYIVKVYVLGKYKQYKNPNHVTRINGDKVFSILFRRIISKGKSIITLESAHEKLDKYYEKELGFQYNYEVSEKFSEIISSKQRNIMYLDKKRRDLKIDHEWKSLFG